MEKKRVVFYGRVSTQSDGQLKALGNQMTWYDQLLLQHPEWEMVGKYEDAGITGTSVRKRKGFRQMLEDGLRFHRYDLIVTRETKRFARNTVDALSYVRLLKQNGIEVYFVSDAIRTISDNDGELRLSIMATIAQEESRKTSENVRAGQRISRQKGILRGTGNILGYRRVGKNQYEIDPEQAAAVRKIYQWYLSGDGIRAIKKKLEAEGYRTASGNKDWQLQAISNVLSNPFYVGRQRQLWRVSDGYLTQRRVRNSPDKVEYIQGDYEPLISEEMFAAAQRIREGRRHLDEGREERRHLDKGKEERESWEKEEKRGRGKRTPKSVWCGKYFCGCGCGTVRKGASRGGFMFTCCQQCAGGRKAEGQCSLKTVMEWKLDMIAACAIEGIWESKGEDIRQAAAVINECFQEEGVNRTESQAICQQLARMEKRRQGLLDMRADGEITRKEYEVKRKECEEEIGRLTNMQIEHTGKRVEIEAVLEEITAYSQPKLNREIVDGWIGQLVHVSDHEFALCLNGDAPSAEGLELGREENPWHKEVKMMKLAKTIKLTYEDAVRYRKKSGRRVVKGKWEDIIVSIYSP